VPKDFIALGTEMPEGFFLSKITKHLIRTRKKLKQALANGMAHNSTQTSSGRRPCNDFPKVSEFQSS
jgi:hypothetical protein